jgi:hypothetical protein
VYSIQLPPDFEKSIEEVEPKCSLEIIADAYEGAINVAGVGRANEDDSEEPLPCFKGHIPKSMLALIDKHLRVGYPEGDQKTQVSDPYHAVKAHAVDATCAFAFAVQYMLRNGYTVEEIRNPDKKVYARFVTYMKTKMNFLGVSGRVKFDGNDIPAPLALFQVQDGENVEVGSMATSGILSWFGNGIISDMWKNETVEPVEPPPPAWTFQYWWAVWWSFRLGVLCCPLCFGMYSGRAEDPYVPKTEFKAV